MSAGGGGEGGRLVNLSAFREVLSLLCSVHTTAEVLELIASMGDIQGEGLACDDDDAPDPEGKVTAPTLSVPCPAPPPPVTIVGT